MKLVESELVDQFMILGNILNLSKVNIKQLKFPKMDLHVNFRTNQKGIIFYLNEFLYYYLNLFRVKSR